MEQPTRRGAWGAEREKGGGDIELSCHILPRTDPVAQEDFFGRGDQKKGMRSSDGPGTPQVTYSCDYSCDDINFCFASFD